MRSALYVLVVAFLATGCASTSQPKLDDAQPTQQAQIQDRLKEIFDAATKKDFPRLDSYHLYGAKFTRFSTESTDRQDSLAAREAEHNGLNAVSGMKINLGNLKIDVFGETAVATFLMRYSFSVGDEKVEREAKGTLVLVN